MVARRKDPERYVELVDEARSGKIRLFGSAEGYLSPLSADASQAAVDALRATPEGGPRTAARYWSENR
jgi:hypothetical protein